MSIFQLILIDVAIFIAILMVISKDVMLRVQTIAVMLNVAAYALYWTKRTQLLSIYVLMCMYAGT